MGRGLGVRLQGMKKLLKLKENINKFGLGYKPTRKGPPEGVRRKEGMEDRSSREP